MATPDTTEFTVNRWADWSIDIEWTDSVGDPIPLTAPEIIEATPQLDGLLMIIETNLPLGQFKVFLEGSAGIPIGTHAFRVRALSGASHVALTQMLIKVE